jgi:hypothetical protein
VTDKLDAIKINIPDIKKAFYTTVWKAFLFYTCCVNACAHRYRIKALCSSF